MEDLRHAVDLLTQSQVHLSEAYNNKVKGVQYCKNCPIGHRLTDRARIPHLVPHYTAMTADLSDKEAAKLHDSLAACDNADDGLSTAFTPNEV
jgi:hypothetical protein